MNTIKNLTNKEMVNKIKDYADIADVSYAFFEYIDENEIWSFSDKFYNEKILKTPKPRWDYADGINLGYEKTINENGISKLAPTAYALCVEARFMQDLVIKQPINSKKETKDIKINNQIKNFISVYEDTKEQHIFVNEEGYHQISKRTKNFTSRFKLLKHQKNNGLGFSATLFEDTENNNKRILVFRGTEGVTDYIADMELTINEIPTQVNSLINFFLDSVIPILKEGEKINICGHSLGGYLTQICAFTFAEYLDEIYTFNSPGILTDYMKTRIGIPNIDAIPRFIRKEIIYLFSKRNVPYYEKLKENLSLADKDHTYLPAPLNVNNIYHMKTDNDSLAFNNKLYENAIQDLGVDISGNEVLINIGNVDAILNTNVSVSSHFLTYTAATLYFFSYLLEQKDNDEKTKNVSLKGTLLYLNEISLYLILIQIYLCNTIA